jgi:uncharacterized protein (TIGR03435 family)
MSRTLARWALTGAVCTAAAFGQEIIGDWQGTMLPPNNPERRVLLKIEKPGAAYKATLYSVDQPGAVLNGQSVTFQGGLLKISIPGIGGGYEGRINSDGEVFNGTFTQGSNPLPLNLKRATADTVWKIAQPPQAMAADAPLSFEVATVKPSDPNAQGRGINVRGNQFTTRNTTLGYLLAMAYSLHPKQIVNAPPWVDSDKWDIVATNEAQGSPSVDQVRTMLKKLLKERFGLAFHNEKRELSAYVIRPGKGEHKMTRNTSGGTLPGLGNRGRGVIVVRNGTMAEWADMLQASILDRPTIDQTGLPGRFDFQLSWTPDEFQYAGRNEGTAPPPPTDDLPRPDLFTAVQEQLGLKLEAAKVPGDVMVIDKVERATEN